MKYASSLEEVEFIEVGVFTDALSGGFPRGRITEIWGDESTGKTTLCLQFIAGAQKQGLKCLFVDAEHSLEPIHLETMGVDAKKLGLIEEEVAEDALNQLMEEITDNKWDVVVIDSIGALRTKAQAEKQLGERTIGSQANLVSNFSRDMATLARYKNTCVIAINHSFVDLMSGKVSTSGGKKWQHYKAFSIRLKGTGTLIKQGEDIVGKKIEATVYKDKVRGNEKAKVEGTILFKSGFSQSEDLWDKAVRKGIATKTGNTWTVDGQKLGTISKVRTWLQEDANKELLTNLLS